MSKQKEYFNFLKSRRAIAMFLLLFVFSVLQAQTVKVSGVVNDESGMPLPGVSVVIDRTSKGTATDFDGKYTIDVQVSEVLTFSYLGFTPQKIKVSTNKLINYASKT